MDDLLGMLLDAQERRKVTAGRWIAALAMGLLASVLVTFLSAAQGIGAFVWLGVIGSVVFGIALIVSIIMHFLRY